MINYYLLTKPGIIMGNLITVAAGFLLASKGNIHLFLFLATLIGLALVIASACVFNNYIDRKIDQKMSRTKMRSLATGSISPIKAILFAVLLGALGNLILMTYTNFLTLSIVNAGFCIYVLLYSFCKLHTSYATLIGSLAGAVPPVVGYTAVSCEFDLGAALLFIIMVVWQMPHFFSIAIYRLNDYKNAAIPVLPVKKGILRTKYQMLFYILLFLAAIILLTSFHYTTYFFLIFSLSLGLLWLLLAFKGFKSDNNELWAKQMFRLSLIVITLMCTSIFFDVPISDYFVTIATN